VKRSDLFGAGIRTVGVYFIAEATYSLLLVSLKSLSVSTGSPFPISLDFISLIWRLSIGAFLIVGAKLIERVVYGAEVQARPTSET
jgi:hypothetical protein